MPGNIRLDLFAWSELETVFQRVLEQFELGFLHEVSDDAKEVSVSKVIGHRMFLVSQRDKAIRSCDTLHFHGKVRFFLLRLNSEVESATKAGHVDERVVCEI